jgi:CubicO group peptidase (beta-lactamase class C family)
MVHGEVHDENAAGLGGVAPHAGLFGTAPDLARFAQMLLNGGVFEQRRYVSRETVERFTARAGVPDSSRALGWDTRCRPRPPARCCRRAPSDTRASPGPRCGWDPQRNLFVILLTNRVHPTRDNNLIRQARPAVADAVVKALQAP